MIKLPPHIKKMICYLRRSRQDVEKEKKTGEDTLAQQKQIMERVLKDYELPYDIFEEIGSGDKIDTRPIFQQVLRLLDQEEYKAIAVREVSRLGRGSYTDMGRIYDLIVVKNILIITPYKIYDPSNPSDLRQIRFELFLSREEFETIRERLMSGKVATALQGKWASGGTAPFGYRVSGETQRLDPFEEEAKIVRIIFDLYVNGLNGKDMGFRAISTYLSRQRIPTPTGREDWSVSIIRKILQEKPETYIGSFMFQTTKMVNGKKIKRPKEEWTIVEDAHTPIIEQDTFDKAQQRMKSRNKPRTNLDLQTSELAGLLVCSKCERRMIRQANNRKYVSKKTGEEKIHIKEILWCNTIGCTFISYRAVEETIIEFITAIGNLDQDDLDDFLRQTQDIKKVETSNEERIQITEETRKNLKKRLEFIFDRFEEGIYSKEEFTHRRDEIVRKVYEIEKNLEVLYKFKTPGEEEINIDIPKIRNIMKSIVQTYHSLNNTEDKNKMLRSIIDHAVLELTEKVGGRKPSKFNLDIFFRMDDFLTL
jgi:site-specific DNA recombinase